MIRCTARTRGSDEQCARERGHTGPHSTELTFDVPEGVAPFLDEAWEQLQTATRKAERYLAIQRLVMALLFLAVGMNLYGALSSLLR